ncbi:MAG: YraN family protein [Gammaproteobacteria bacterium]
MNTSPTVRTGLAHEQRALDYLTQQGLDLVERNFRCKLGEIDLIMRDDDVTVFVEVRYRRSSSHGGALASIGQAKAQRIAATAQIWLRKTRATPDRPIRFDVVALEGPQPTLRWLKAAFEF